MASPPKTIFIDWNGTLSFSKWWGQLFQSHPSEVVKIRESLFENLKKLLNPWGKGKYTTEDIMRLVSKDSGVDYAFIVRELEVSCRQMRLISEETPSLLKQIKKKGVPIVLATDNMDTFDRWTVPSLGLERLFNEILNSYTIGFLKDDIDSNGNSLFFSNFFTQTNIDPRQTILIDNSKTTKKILGRTGIKYLLVTPDRDLNFHLKSLLDHWV